MMGMMGARSSFDRVLSPATAGRGGSEPPARCYRAAYFVLYPFISRPRTVLGVPLPAEVIR